MVQACGAVHLTRGMARMKTSVAFVGVCFVVPRQLYSVEAAVPTKLALNFAVIPRELLSHGF